MTRQQPSWPPPPAAKKAAASSSSAALTVDQLVENSVRSKEEIFGRELTAEEVAAVRAKVQALMK